MRTRTSRRRVGLLAALWLGGVASGCAGWLGPEESVTRVVLWFEEYDEVFTGTATRRGEPLRGAFLDVTNQHADLRCVGPTQVSVVPPAARPPLRCDGMRGVSELSCSDGRRVAIEFVMEEGCGRGYGRGRDDHGHPVHAVFGQSAPRAELAAQEARSRVAGLPRLPRREPGSAASRGVSTGTAFFVSWEGHLVTNHHVVDGSDKVQVQLPDGDLEDARVVALDEVNDLALLVVDRIARPLPLAGEAPLVKGEEVFALGYPLVAIQGQEQKATFGRVNALSGAQGDARFAQIDVPIQPGNSGGPLLDRDGEVVGVVTSMLHQQAVLEAAGVIPQNVNYALKSDFVRSLLEREIAEPWTAGRAAARERRFSELVAAAQGSVVLVVAW